MRNTKISLAARLALGVSAAVLMMQGSALAQSAPADAAAANDDMQEIVVSGFRHSLESAIEAKRDASQIVEAISAEDIGKLPDNSIAESLARLPGLAAQRVDGRAQVISLRGLGPDFTLTTLNGREQVSTGNNRSVEYDLYPSEIISSAVVYKTPQAGFTAQGLAGTVDLQTVRPLDYGKQVLSASARYEQTSIGKLNSDSEDKGYRASATYIDQFAHDTLGVSLSIAHLNSPTQQETSRVWGYPQLSNGSYVIGGDEVRANSEEFNRTGIMSTVQYKPTDNFTTSLDFFYTHYQDYQWQRGIEMPLQWGNGSAIGAQPPVALLPGYTTAGNMITSGAFSGVKGVGRSDEGATQSDLYSIGWNGRYTKGDWTGTLDAGYSQADRTTTRFESYFGTGSSGSSGATDTIGFTNVGTNVAGYQYTHNLNYADPNLIKLTDPNNWNGGTTPYAQNGYLNKPRVHDDLYSLKGDLKKDFHEVAFLKDIDIGVNYTERNKEYYQPEWYVTLTSNLTAPVDPLTGVRGASAAIPSWAMVGTADLSWIGLGNTVAYNPVELLSRGVYSLVPCGQYRANCTGDSHYTVDEKVTTAFVKADVDGNLGSVKVTGNVGLQLVHTDQSSTGIAVSTANSAAGVYAPRTEGVAYNDLLPSLNLSFVLPNPDHQIRLGAAREMMRARMDQMQANLAYSFDSSKAGYTGGNLNNSPWSGNGGNPYLKPWYADAVDLSYEYYFNKAGYLSLAAFYKHLENNIYNKSTVTDFTGVTSNSTTGSSTTLGYVTVPVNGAGGMIEGVEAAFAVPLDMVWSKLDGFGINGAAGWTQTDLQAGSQGVGSGNSTLPVAGYSKWTEQGTLYYENGGFGARVSVTHRSGYLSEQTGFGQGREFDLAVPETLVDAQVSYDFGEGALKGLSIVLQAQNLTDEPVITYYNGDTTQNWRYEKYGVRYLLGASYKY
ncbi:iron complex outermembrane receptor protein [Nitrospirillum amazonense]|uniref:Iron complex outermembrane receptor protein n=1 Tax=Nitrospirillum amazonense TaxID=28077 RepID=A0A560FS26_9PROT|nr:TonB-dependent receptor [Nitrospirillum amazonense]TWB24445.1 iron complex outermembrane receptor protein [Nitrospirillum amazonense]